MQNWILDALLHNMSGIENAGIFDFFYSMDKLSSNLRGTIEVFQYISNEVVYTNCNQMNSRNQKFPKELDEMDFTSHPRL